MFIDSRNPSCAVLGKNCGVFANLLKAEADLYSSFAVVQKE